MSKQQAEEFIAAAAKQYLEAWLRNNDEYSGAWYVDLAGPLEMAPTEPETYFVPCTAYGYLEEKDINAPGSKHLTRVYRVKLMGFGFEPDLIAMSY
jgi:hypothetical protein